MRLSTILKPMLYLLILSLSFFACANNSAEGGGKEPVAGVQPANTSSGSNAGALTLQAGNVTGSTGETVCVGVTVQDFQGILSTQYTLAWDPALLRFNRLQSYNLPMFGEENFGTHRVSEGLLTSVWIDMSLQGVNKAAGEQIYEVCFDIVGASGSSGTIEFRQSPTPFEAVNVQEKLLELKGVAGTVTIQ